MVLVLHQIYIDYDGSVKEMPVVAVNWNNVDYVAVDKVGSWVYFAGQGDEEGIHVRETMDQILLALASMGAKQILLALASMGAKVRDVNA